MRKKHVTIDDLSIWKTDKPRNKWWKRVYGLISYPLITALLIVGFTKMIDYYMTSKHITQGVRAHMVSFVPHGDQVSMSFMVANDGNRQSIVSMVLPDFPLKFGRGTAHLSLNPSAYTTQGLPAPLNPGETRLVTIKGPLPIQSMYENGSPDGAPEENIRKAAISLCFRSQDFHGQRYDAAWELGEISVNSARVARWRKLSDSFPVFDQRYQSTSCMLTFDGMALREF